MAKGKPGRPPKKKEEPKVEKVEEVVEEKVEVKEESKPEPKKEVKQEQPKEEPKRRVKKQIERNALIPCRSIVYGGLTFKSKKTGAVIVWENYGIVEDVEYQDLQGMKASGSRFLKEPWIIPEDEEVIDALKLREIYDEIVDLEDLEGFFKQSFAQIQESIGKIPDGMKELLKSKAVEMIKKEELNDLRIVKLIDRELNCDLLSLLS